MQDLINSYEGEDSVIHEQQASFLGKPHYEQKTEAQFFLLQSIIWTNVSSDSVHVFQNICYLRPSSYWHCDCNLGLYHVKIIQKLGKYRKYEQEVEDM